MKKSGLIALLSIMSYFNYAQLNTADIFTGTNLVWYGLDFSKAKFIGKFEQAKNFRPVNSFDIVNKYIPSWNELVVMEPDNFDLKSTFRKKHVYYDLKPVAARNEKISTDDLITLNSNSISSDELQSIISSYTPGDKKEGIGLVLIVESFNKPFAMASAWVVFFDIKSKTVLLSDYCKGKPVGFGLRNYWAGSVKHMLAEIRFWKYDNWRRQYAKPKEINNGTARK
jgi:hypothetical protein